MLAHSLASESLDENFRVFVCAILSMDASQPKEKSYALIKMFLIVSSYPARTALEEANVRAERATTISALAGEMGLTEEKREETNLVLCP